jgi:hypothetical protein
MFDEAQTATLRAVVDRIIPADDFPGGWEAGVGTYLSTQLQGDLREMLETYHIGLDDLDREALAQAGASFAALDDSSQDALLVAIERGDVQAPWRVDPRAFFRMLIDHTIEGYYGSPDNGGNLGRVSWRMIGFEVRG